MKPQKGEGIVVTTPPLTDIRVLELSTGIAGQTAGMLLADLGYVARQDHVNTVYLTPCERPRWLMYAVLEDALGKEAKPLDLPQWTSGTVKKNLLGSAVLHNRRGETLRGAGTRHSPSFLHPR